jgi:hypothetical protein
MLGTLSPSTPLAVPYLRHLRFAQPRNPAHVSAGATINPQTIAPYTTLQNQNLKGASARRTQPKISPIITPRLTPRSQINAAGIPSNRQTTFVLIDFCRALRRSGEGGALMTGYAFSFFFLNRTKSTVAGRATPMQSCKSPRPAASSLNQMVSSSACLRRR